MIRLESFDVFDTLLTRAVGAPTSVFVLLGRLLCDRLIVAVSPLDFARQRVEAQAKARQKRGGGEVSLEMIYRELALMLPLSTAAWRKAMHLECEIEQALIRLVPGADNKVSDARRRNGKVIFLCDMYLPEHLIVRWLEQHGLWGQRDRLYLSNEEDASKSTGELFRQALRKERLEPRQLTHLGNNPHADVASALRQGVRAFFFAEGNLNRYENLMEAAVNSTGGLSSLMAGASRLARLSLPAEDEAKRTLRDVSAGVMAPALAAFVIWVLRRAQARSLRRLYFMSRDGQILLEIARRIAPKLGIECELRYLYSSRQSWHLPSIITLDDAKLEWLFMKYDFLSIESLLFRVGITPHQVANELEIAGFRACDWRRQLNAAEIERLKTLLWRGQIREMIVFRARAKRAVLVGYLRQEGLLDGEPWALVDLGWNGRLQASLGEVLRSVGGAAPHGFYFALDSRPRSESAGTFEAYMFDQDSMKHRAALSEVNIYTVMEIACSADHGTVDGFAQTPCGYKPVLRSERNQLAIDWGLPLMQQAICRFSDHLVLSASLIDISADMRTTLVALLNAFWKHPTPLEVSVWGAFHFEKDQSGATAHQIAKPYTIAAIHKALLGQSIMPSSSSWQHGSISISPWPIRLALQFGSWLKRMKRVLWSARAGIVSHRKDS
ncbi:MAG TPA: hypothetical protein VIS96_02645 [Terrimicrobiaceae bacterium]